MRTSNTARRLVGTIAAGAVTLTACAVVMLVPTSADTVNSLQGHELVQARYINSL